MTLVAKLIWFVCSVGGLLVALVIVTAWLSVRRWSGAARKALVAVIAFYGVSSVYVVPYGVSRLLAHGYRQLSASDISSGRTVIIALGAGEWYVHGSDEESLTMLNGSGASRILETSRVYRLSADAWVISSGGIGTGTSDGPTSAVAMQERLVQLGVPTSRIVLEDASRTTRDEAVLVAPILNALHPDRVVLVTSAEHMRRSLATYRAAGITAMPSPSRDPLISRGWRTWALPSAAGLEFTGGIIHELLGLSYYALRGWLR